MDNKLQQLTDKLYAEGVEKGKAEAQDIIAQAQQQADKIKEEAQNEANRILDSAKKSAAETEKNTKAELRLYTEQSLNALKTEITNLISDQIAADSVKAATADPAFMQSIITKIASQWVENGNVDIDTKDAAALTAYFNANAKEILSKGVKINEVKGIKTDFVISPAHGGYKITFGNDEFIAYFKEFLRPKLIEMLF